jgi:hypothetical protein
MPLNVLDCTATSLAAGQLASNTIETFGIVRGSDNMLDSTDFVRLLLNTGLLQSEEAFLEQYAEFL